MTDQQSSDSSRDEETMATLLKMAGPRPSIDKEVEARVYARVHEEWQAQARPAQRYMKWAAPFALAASVILAVMLVWSPSPDVDAQRVGSIVMAAAGSSVATGDAVLTGETLSTGGSGGMSLQLNRGTSLRLDANTRLEVEGPGEFTLLAGRIYADTGEFIYRDNGLDIHTELGTVTDIGTQFAVSIDAGSLNVAVREGRVELGHAGGKADAAAGELLTLPPDGALSRDSLSPTDDYWQWAVALAPAFEIEGRTLLEFLKWAAREGGLQLEFVDNDLRREAMRTVLHGSIDGFTPVDAAKSVLATTDFRYRIEDQRIVINR